jgi:photosystem II stability/assembly factor-like uncharacterized protein
MKINTLLLALGFLLISSGAYSQGFNSIYTPDGTNVIAVGDNGLMFRSANSGATWGSYTVGADNLKSVFAVNDDVWIAAANGKVYKTLKVTSPVSSVSTGTANTLNSVMFVNTATGFVCGDGGVVYKTVNGGVNWTSSNSGIPAVNLNSISFKDANNGVVVGAGGACYTTTNGGTSWSSLSVGTTKNLLEVRYYNDGIAACGEFGALYLKPNAGSFAMIPTRVNTDIRGISGSSLTDLHVCGGGGFIRNNTSGSANFLNFEINPMMANLVDIHYYNSAVGFAVSSLNKAIIKTTNGGASWLLTAGTTMSASWEQKLAGGGSGIGNNLCPHPTDRDAMFVAYGTAVYRSGNRGETWTQVGSLSTGRAHSFYVSPLDSNLWMAAVDNTSPDKVIRSTNYGQTWTTILSLNFSNYGQPLEMDQNNPNIWYFAPDNGGFWKSTNGGANFTEISGNYPFRSPCDIAVAWDSSNIVFVGDGVTGSGLAKMFKSTNGGVNWTDVLTTVASEIPSMCNTVFDKSKYYCTEWSGSNIYKSTDYGSTWSISHSTGFSGWASDICREDPTVIYTGNYGSNSGISTNNGANWLYNTSGQSGSGAGCIVPERGYVLSMQTGNLYKMKFTYTVTTAVPEIISANIPDKFDLHQNYPNPFNPSTTIKYDISRAGNIKLKVYNQLGKEVAELYNGFVNAGSYQVIFDASALSSGIYFYKLETPDASYTKKMLLVK